MRWRVLLAELIRMHGRTFLVYGILQERCVELLIDYEKNGL